MLLYVKMKNIQISTKIKFLYMLEKVIKWHYTNKYIKKIIEIVVMNTCLKETQVVGVVGRGLDYIKWWCRRQ